MPFKLRPDRRSFLSLLSAAGVGVLGARKLKAGTLSTPAASGRGYAGWPDGNLNAKITLTGFGSTGDVWAELGVKPLINGWGTMTDIGGSLIPPEVEAVMRLGSNHFGSIDELERAAGTRIAAMLKLAPGNSALVTCGASAAILAGYAGVLTGTNPAWIKQIPDLTGMPKTEVIIQKSHRYDYDHQIRQTGVKLIEVETRAQLLAALGPQTAGMHFLNKANALGQIKVDEFLKIAQAHGVPAHNDAAADTPPISRLWEYVNMGYDLVTFSGGKDMRGPQCAGLLLGKQPLIEAALLNMSPQDNTIGRASKVGKEEIFGMIKALELFLGSDQEALLQSYYARLDVIADAVKRFPGVETDYQFDPNQIANHTPVLTVTWDPAQIKLTRREVFAQLAATEPAGIRLAGGGHRGGRPSLGVLCWQLKPGEEHIIARRLSEIFRHGAVQS